MTREHHPYGEFIPKNARAMIIGSFPIAKFTDPKRASEIGPLDKDFFFGGEKNLLWKLLGDVFNMPVDTTPQIKALLKQKGLAIGDVIRSCVRKNGGASDSDLYDIEWNHELIKSIRKQQIQTLYFTSKKVELWFNKLFPETQDLVKVTLISPSAQSVRSLFTRTDFKQWVEDNPLLKKYEYILRDYRIKFESIS